MKSILIITVFLLLFSSNLTLAETANGIRECETNACCRWDEAEGAWYWYCFTRRDECVNYGCFLVCTVDIWYEFHCRPSMCSSPDIHHLGGRQIIIDCGDNKPGYSETLTIHWCQYDGDNAIPEHQKQSIEGASPCQPPQVKPSCFDSASILCNFAGCKDRVCNEFGFPREIIENCMRCEEKINIEEYFND